MLNIPLFPDKSSLTWLSSPIINPALFLFALGWLINYEFRKNRKIERSKAAIKASILTQECTDYIIDVINKPGYYEKDQYYPFKIPEIPDDKLKSDKSRPSRIIFNNIHNFRKSLNEQTAQISGKEAEKLKILLAKYVQQSNSIGNAQGTCNENIALETLPHIKEDEIKIKAINKEIQDILTPIIDGRGIPYFSYKWIIDMLKQLSLSLYYFAQYINMNFSSNSFNILDNLIK